MNAADDFLRKTEIPIRIVLCLALVSFAGSASPVTKRSLFSEPTKSVPGPEKNYTGLRVKNDSLLLIYYHEQTVAVVETDAERTLHNCELLEVRTKADKKVALNSLKPVIPVQMRIQLTDMLDLMNQCNKLNFPSNFGRGILGESKMMAPRGARQFISIFSGLFPGTKWCGAGDAAASYHDLGSDREMDKCCRNHDLCPVKVAGLKTQYNLTNYAIYTRSHCLCDDIFYDCLKALGTSLSDAVGRIYFNVAPVVCVEDVLPGDGTMNEKRQFTNKRRRF